MITESSVPLAKQSITLAARTSSVPLARAWVRSVLTEIGRSDLRATTELATSELVTNAIIHSSGPIEVVLEGTHQQPRIEVHDRDSARLLPQRHHRNDAVGGRGLLLVATASVRCGVVYDDADGSKVLWFEPALVIHGDPDLTGFYDGAAR